LTILTRRRALFMGAALFGSGLPGSAEAYQGRVELKIFSAGFILGAGGGSGVLYFQGGQYPLNVGGVSLGATIGISEAQLFGTASHLQVPGDIQGTYTSASAGLAIAGGGTAATLSNGRGVVLHLRGRQVGFKFSLALSGLTISLK
jgi:hypothetical protein